MLEIASFLKYVDLYLTSEWGRFYVGHPVLSHEAQNALTATDLQPSKPPTNSYYYTDSFCYSIIAHHQGGDLIIARMKLAASTSKTSVKFHQITRSNIAEDSHLQV
jgi:hypothetical protein